MLVALIMAGGSGERFWPLSTPKKPKQLLKIFSKKSMIRETVDRILPIISSNKIFIATNILQSEEIKKELPEIPIENIIIEPLFKDTAAAIGYGALIIEHKFKNEKIEVVVLASDHLIEKVEEFREIILISEKKVRENSIIVTLGIKPDKPEIGYGYIEIENSGVVKLNEIYDVKKFKEKPNKETAELYVTSGKYLWNSGMFIFSLETIFENFEILMPKHTKIFSELRKEIEKNKIGEELSINSRLYFENFEKISIDFGIMEYSKNIKVIPVEIGWNDIGSFEALEDILLKDPEKNLVKNSRVIAHESNENIVITDGLTVALLGVNNLVIVKNGDNILISKKESLKDIKKIVTKYNKLIT